MIFFLFVVLSGCDDRIYKTKHVPNPNAIKYGFHLKEFEDGVYQLAFLGNPGTTLEYAQETWDYRADTLCAPLSYEAIYITNKIVSGEDTYRTKGLLNENSNLARGMRIDGSLLATIFEGILTGGEVRGNVEYPTIEGQITCVKKT